MFFEYQLDEEIKEVIGIGFHSIERSRLSELQCYVYMVVQEKKGEKIVVLELKVQVKELKPSLLFNNDVLVTVLFNLLKGSLSVHKSV